MKEPDINIYVSAMEEIKRRTSVIYSFFKGTSHPFIVLRPSQSAREEKGDGSI